MKPYENKDGLARDLARMAYEGRLVASAFTITLFDFLVIRGGWREIGHNYVDIFVESLRAGPYFWGHIVCWVPLYWVAKAWW
jgi:hypothetical protein